MRRDESKWYNQGLTKQWWKGLTRAEKQIFINNTPRADLEDFLHDWRIWAHDYQIPPETLSNGMEWDTWLFLGGRGSGKTRSAAEYVTDCVKQGWARRIAIVGQGEDDVRNVIVEGESGLLACAPPGFKPNFKPSSGGGKVIWPNGCTAFIYSIADTEALRGPQFHLGWCDEPMAAPRVQRERALDNLEFCLRLGEHPQMILTTTPKPDPWLRQIEREAKDPARRIYISRATLQDNRENLPDSFIAKIERKYGGSRLGKQEIQGLILGEEEGALWTEDVLEACRKGYEEMDPYALAARCDKVIVAIDPNTKGATTAANSKKIAHAAGIIVVGKIGRERFVLADRSVGGGPPKWSKAAIDAAREFDADEVFGESNQGGEMVRMVILQAMTNGDYTVPIHIKHTNKSKPGRAEPVATLYDQKLVHHVGPKADYENLEMQMLYLHEGEDPTKEDFDRCDALVWGLTRLGLKKRASSGGRVAGFSSFGDTNGAPQGFSNGGDLDDWSPA